jgi:hypothetical protein
MRLPTIILLFFFISNPSSAEGEEWKLQLDKNDIKVYTLKRDSTKILGIKAETIIHEATFEELKEVLLDVGNLKKWVGDCKRSEVLEEISQEELIYRMVLKVPFPFQDRDMIQHISISEQTSDQMRVTLVNKPQQIPPDDKAVRMPVADGYWEFKALPEGDVHAFLKYDSDPGGEIPAWLINMFIVQSPYKTLLNLRSLIEEE